MIDQLLEIKTFREKKAQTLLVKERLRLAQAQSSESQAEEALNRFVEQAERQELHWYRELCARVVRVGEITRVHEQVAALRVSEREHAERLEAARQAHREAVSAFDSSYQGYRTACTTREKFEELLRQEIQRESAEFERREEAELEELYGNLRDRFDEEASAHV